MVLFAPADAGAMGGRVKPGHDGWCVVFQSGTPLR